MSHEDLNEEIAMTFSIIVVSYNAGAKLHETVESIRRQTEEDYEIIVQDGLSTDGSVGKLSIGEDLKLFTGEDAGIYDAMNRAVAHASGRYIFFLNCGDYFADDMVLARVKREIEKSDRHVTLKGGEGKHGKTHLPPRIFYGNIRERATGAHVMSNPRIDDFACYRNVPCHQACFYDRRLLVKRGFRIRYRVRADYEHFLWCYYRAHASMVYMPLTVASYEGGGFSEKEGSRKRSREEHARIVRKYMSRGQILKYRFLLFITFSRLRTYLSSNKRTAAIYQNLIRRMYRKRQEPPIDV